MKSRKGMCTAWMPDSAFGRVAMMTDPYVRVKVFELVVTHHVIAVADHLQHEQILPVRKDKGSFVSLGGIKGMIEAETVLVDNFVLYVT